MKKKKNKHAKRRLIIFGSISIIGIIYFLTTLFKYTTEIKSLKLQEQTLTLKLDDLKHESENLKVEIEKLKDPEYIARYAREKYSYSKENGEYIIRIEDDNENVVTVEEIENDNHKYYIISISILLGIVIYILKK